MSSGERGVSRTDEIPRRSTSTRHEESQARNNSANDSVADIPTSPSSVQGLGNPGHDPLSANGVAQASNHTNLSEGAEQETRRSSNVPNLTIDVQRATGVNATKGVGPARSPLSTGEDQPSSAQSAPSRFASSSLPLSPRTRQRGASLRRAVFTRGIQEQSDHGPASPGQVARLPNVARRPSQASGSSERSKKSEATVTVSPALLEHDVFELQARNRNVSPGSPTLPRYENWARSKAARASLRSRAYDAYERARKTILRIRVIPPSKDGRHIVLDPVQKKEMTDERTGRQYVDNTICSSKYTPWNFLPRQLFAQFSKLANFYFLCVSILQMIPGLSTTGSYTTIVPLAFFVIISMAKEGYEDIRRYKLDKAENTKDASVLHADEPGLGNRFATASGPKHWELKKWKDITVGEIIRLRRDEAAPADLTLLQVDGQNDTAYFETMALDGETNLKSKQASPLSVKAYQTLQDIHGTRAELIIEDPNLDLYKFEGKVTLEDQTLPLTNSEVVYRGSILRNTNEAIGLAIYTGEECKIRMNATKNPRIKAPALQFVVNKIVIAIVIFVIALAIFNTVAYQIWQRSTERKSWYLVDAVVAFFPILTSFIILFNTMVPLSLYVSLEIVKLCQMVLMNDIEMYDAPSNTPMEARTSTINEELGQVNYVFSDKTGTLTNNSMRFRKMTIAGTAWLHDFDMQKDSHRPYTRTAPHQKRDKGKESVKRETHDSRPMGPRQDSFAQSGRTVEVVNPTFHRSESLGTQGSGIATREGLYLEQRTEDLLHYVRSRPHTIFAKKARFFLLSLALCHTCIPETDEHGELNFQAASPDEAALVRAAKELGYIVVDRQAATITIKTFPTSTSGEPVSESYEVLDVIEFSSTRKRMSIIVRFPDKRICVFCKGADSMIVPRLRQANLARDQANKVEHRVHERQSLEAQAVLRRNSEQQGRKSSTTRTSFSMHRHSVGGVPRHSLVGNHLRPIRDQVDDWLVDRETDVDLTPRGDAVTYYSPRPSQTFRAHSLPLSPGGRTSFQSAEEEVEDLVDEALVINDAAVFERCFQHVNDFSNEGLRTLMYGYRYLTEDEYSSWRKLYLDASTSLIDRQERIEQVGNLVEQDFELAGATAIEDKLQDGVPETIEKLRRAGIKLWMLTGDKRETAVNIGHSCRLIKDYSSITILDHESGDVDQRMAAATLDIDRGTVAHSVVVIDGQTLSMVEADKTSKRLFTDLAILVDTVICCRASPSQKAWLVATIRRKVRHAVTLAIGDGANDIAMIQEAHVGIGITGKEGLQAARTSDYSIAQFRFLLRLLLVHGRWNYIRTCKYVLSTFWKEMLFYLTQALFQRYAGYTGTSLYESWSLSMFNTLFTSLPVIFIGIFEKDLSPATLLAVPELYTIGHRNGGFNFLIYAGWVFLASAEAVLIFFLMLGLYGHASINTSNDLYSMGALTFTACVIVIAVKIQFLEIHNKSITCAIAMFLSIGGWWLFNLILSAIYGKNTIYDVKRGLLDRFGRNALWWLTLIVTIIAVGTFEIAIKCLRGLLTQSDVEIFQELEKDPMLKQRFEEHADLSTAKKSRFSLGRRPSDWVEETRKKNRSSDPSAADDAKREVEVEELLRRPRVMFADRNNDPPEGIRRRQPSETDEVEEGSSNGIRRRQLSMSEDNGDGIPLEPMKTGEEAMFDDERDKGHAVASPTSATERSKFVRDALRGAFGTVRRSLDMK